MNFCCRFSYCAICCLSLLGRLSKINVEKAVNFIVSCKNLDGGFGSIPGGESHAGQSIVLLCYYYIVLVLHFKPHLSTSFTWSVKLSISYPIHIL